MASLDLSKHSDSDHAATLKQQVLRRPSSDELISGSVRSGEINTEVVYSGLLEPEHTHSPTDIESPKFRTSDENHAKQKRFTQEVYTTRTKKVSPSSKVRVSYQDDDTFSNSINACFQDSREGKEDNEKLNEVYKNRPGPIPTVPEVEKSNSFHYRTHEYDYEEELPGNLMFWKHINSMLGKYNLPTIAITKDEYEREYPNLNSIGETLIEIIAEVNNLKRNVKDKEQENTRLYSELESVYETNEKLKYDLDKLIKSQQEQRASLTPTKKLGLLKGEDIFRAVLNRNFNPKSKGDSSIMTIIKSYEERIQTLEAELSKYTSTRTSQSLNPITSPDSNTIGSIPSSVKKNFRQHSFGESDYDEYNKIVNDLAEMLEVSPLEVLPTVSTLKSAYDVLAESDSFILSISKELIPPSELEKSANNRQLLMKQILAYIKSLKVSITEYNRFFSSLIQATGVSQDNIEGYVVECTNSVKYFEELFDVEENDNVMGVMEQVFLFVHEMRMFLQYSRRVLQLEQDMPVGMVLEAIKERLI